MLKRLFDIAASSLTLVFLSPLLLIIAAAIKLDSEGPVLFRQARVGKHGRQFTIYKFRKFPITCDGQGPSITAIDDPRLSRAGKILERLKLDELPQFLNVLKGDMSLVGPRPEIPKFVERYSASARRVLDVKPGIFGVNQLLFTRESEVFPEGVDPEEFYVKEFMLKKLENDIEYIRQATFLTDLTVLVRCVWNVVYRPLYNKIARK